MNEKGRLFAICVSDTRGTAKNTVDAASLTVKWGIEGDAHGGDWHRQVSLLSLATIDRFNERGADAAPGAFGENLIIDGIDVARLPVGARVRVGEALLEVTQIGKKCHRHCAIYHRMGDCIMPREGVFARVAEGGGVRVGDDVYVLGGASGARRAAVVTLSDKAARGLREDESGPAVSEMLLKAGWTVETSVLLPDERAQIEEILIDLADRRRVDAVFTTGGTGFAPRDVTPEATIAVCDRMASGIAEALRAHSMAITPRAMFSRAQSGIRFKTLIINLPGSPNAVRQQLEYLLPRLPHAIETLRGEAYECAKADEPR